MYHSADRRSKKEEKSLLCDMSCLRKPSGKKGVGEKGVLCVWLSGDAE